MFLERLVEYAERQEDLAPLMYSEKPVRYVIELDGDGRLRNPEPIDMAGSERGQARGQRLIVPDIVRTAGIKPLLLADQAEYTFGLPRDPANAERVARAHAAYVDLLRDCAAQTEDADAAAVLAFFDGGGPEGLELDEAFDRSALIVFRVDGRYAHRRPAVQRFWAAYNTPDDSEKMSCIVCGRQRPPLERLRGKIKGIPDGQASGTSLISANAKAFESYGLRASLIAPTCAECGDMFTKGLNRLLRADDGHMRLGGLVFIYWTREPVAFSFSSFLETPDPALVGDLLASVWGGAATAVPDDTAFYAASLSANSSRAVLRDWIETTLGEVRRGLAVWFRAQAIVDAWGEAPRPLGVYALGGSTVRDLKDVPATTYRALLRAALSGAPVPWSLLQQALRRCHAEGDVTRPRAALIKLVLATNQVIEEDSMVMLQEDHPQAAYHCGRLLAVLESIQRAALGDVNAGVVDRYYGTASTAPASVFGRLLRGAQPHLNKLQRDRPGTAYALEERLEQVLGALDAFPQTLDLAEQGLFALGYYHQRAFDRAQAAARKEARAAAQQA